MRAVPAWFVVALLCLNLGAAGAFLCCRPPAQRPWALIYLGAALIQTGTLWLMR